MHAWCGGGGGGHCPWRRMQELPRYTINKSQGPTSASYMMMNVMFTYTNIDTLLSIQTQTFLNLAFRTEWKRLQFVCVCVCVCVFNTTHVFWRWFEVKINVHVISTYLPLSRYCMARTQTIANWIPFPHLSQFWHPFRNLRVSRPPLKNMPLSAISFFFSAFGTAYNDSDPHPRPRAWIRARYTVANFAENCGILFFRGRGMAIPIVLIIHIYQQWCVLFWFRDFTILSREMSFKRENYILQSFWNPFHNGLYTAANLN